MSRARDGKASGKTGGFTPRSPSPSVTAFLLAPELKSAEWLASAGGKVEREDTLDDALLRASTALGEQLQKRPEFSGLIEVFLWKPEHLAALPVEPKEHGLELLHYLRLSAAREYHSLWVQSDEIRSRASRSPDGPAPHQEEFEAQEGTARLRKAFCAYFGTRDFWKTRSLTEHELFRLVNMHHLPQSREAALLGALREVADGDGRRGGAETSRAGLSRSLACVEKLRMQLEYIDRLETAIPGRKPR